MESGKTIPKSMSNSITDYIVSDHGELEKYNYSLSTEWYCEDQRLLVKHRVYTGCSSQTCVLSLAGMESPFLTATHKVLGSRSVTEHVDDTPVFWLLLNSTCTACRLSLFLLHSAPTPASRFGGG